MALDSSAAVPDAALPPASMQSRFRGNDDTSEVPFIVSALLMMALYARFGFARIPAPGHLPSLPMPMVIYIRCPAAAGAFRIYPVLLLVFMMISLIFDVMDVR